MMSYVVELYTGRLPTTLAHSAANHQTIIVRHKIVATERFRESLPKRGAEIFATKIFVKAALIHCIIL